MRLDELLGICDPFEFRALLFQQSAQAKHERIHVSFTIAISDRALIEAGFIFRLSA